MVKRKGRFRSPGRSIRQTERFLLLISVPHPPVKGARAHKSWKNVSMSTRLRLYAQREAFRQLVRDAHDDYATFERRSFDAEVTLL